MTSQFYCGDLGLIPGWGTKITLAVQCNKKKKQTKKIRLAKGYGHTLALERDSV